MFGTLGKSLRHKVLAAILFTSVVSLLASYAVLLLIEWNNAEDELVDKLHTEARIVRDNVSAAVAFETSREAQRMMQALEIDNEVIAAAIYLENGKLFASYVDTGSTFALPDTLPTEGIQQSHDALVIVLPIEVGGERVGRLLIAGGYEVRNQRFILYLAIAGTTFVVAIAITVLLSQILEERLSKPILALAASARRVVDSRDYSIEIETRDESEVGQLATAFAQMLREVNQRESKLTQARDRLRLALNASKTFTWEWDRETNLIQLQTTDEMAPELAALSALEPAQMLECILPGDRKKTEAICRRLAALNDVFDHSFTLVSNGRTIELEIRGKGFRDARGTLIRAVGVGMDTTERRQTERALYWREQEFKALVEHSPDIISRYDRDLRIQYINPMIEHYTGVPPSRIIGRKVTDLEYAGPRAEIWRIALERVFNGAPYAEVETDVPHPDGSVHSFSARLVPEFDPEGNVTHVLAVSREITERKQAERDLREAKERAEAAVHAKSIFLANMSHDIRTPLTAILGFAEILDRKCTGELKNMSTMIRNGGKRLRDTLDSVLDLARLEGGKSQLKIGSANITHEIRDLVRMFAAKASERGLDLRFLPPDEVVRGKVDGAAFNRVMMNLLGNAVKFTKEGSITVRLWQRDDTFFVSVEDTGPGIASEELPTIFDAFTRTRQSELSRSEGSGLGLTITRQLINLMDGHIHVESEVGKGSVFTVSLPAETREESPESTADASPKVTRNGSGRPAVLTVEDNPHTMQLVEMMLAEHYDADVISNGPEALQLARQKHYDVVLMDLSLESSEAGVDYLRRLRNLEGYRKVPIIAFTAHALPGEADRFRRLGFDDYLGKPFTQEDLEACLEHALGSSRRERDS